MTSHEQEEPGPDPPRQHCAHPRGAPRGRREGQIQGLRGTLGRALPCSVWAMVSPPLLQLPSHLFSPAPQLPLSPKAPSCSLPTSFSSTHSCWTGRRGRSWQPPESPKPPCPHVSLPYREEGSPHADALRAAQSPAAQRGADCVPEEAAPLARLCLAFIGNEDEGFGSGLRGSP